VAEFVPHSWLLPRAACIVHHGGAGTTAAAFRAGIPQAFVSRPAKPPVKPGAGARRSGTDSRWVAITRWSARKYFETHGNINSEIRALWAHKSRCPGRPPIDREVVELIECVVRPA
jgi:hypothetical protein